MDNTTKTRILDEALVSFAANGYKGTNLRDLAAQLGLSKSALYRHFDSKEAIWNAVIDMMEAYYNEGLASAESTAEAPKSCQELFAMTMRMIDFTIHDPRVILTRRILLVEQFRDERIRGFATLHFLTGTEEIYTKIFAEMMENGVLKKDDPEMLAFSFTAPITSLIHLCDREPEREPEIMEKIKAFIEHFISVYGG